MRSRAVSVAVLVMGLLSTAALSAGATGCTSPAEEARPADNAGTAVAVGATASEGGAVEASAEDGSPVDLRVTLPPSVTTATELDVDATPSSSSTSGSATPEGATTIVADSTSSTTGTTAGGTSTAPTTIGTTTVPTGGGVVGQRPDGAGNPADICLDGVIQPMADDATCGYADIGGYCLEQINHWRAQEGLAPFVRLAEFEACAAREARLALEAGWSHFSDGCGWRSQASSGGGRGGEGSNGTIERSVWWLPKLIFDEGPDGGHYQGMMTERVRGVACGYFASNRDEHRIIINYYDL